MGVFVVFEGGEGAGKTTQARVLARRLQREGHPAVLIREPGGTSLGESLRRLLKGRSDVTPIAELLLFMAARSQLVEEVIAPTLRACESVVCDRFSASTLAYQGYGRGLSLSTIEELGQVATGGLQPDLNILLDIPVASGLARKGDGGRDTFESQAAEFHERVRKGYLEIARGDPARWLVIDGTGPRNAISGQVWEKVKPLL